MGRTLVAELPRAIIRLSAALVVYGLITAVPWPPGMARWVTLGAVAGLATACLIVCGVLLVNTLFFERHWRQVDSR